MTDAEIAGRKMVTHVEGTRLSDFSALVDVIRGNIAWLIFQTVLPINTFVGDFPLSLRWTRVMHVIRNRLIDPSVPTSPFVLARLVLMYPRIFRLDHSISDDKEETVYVLLHGSCSFH